MCSDLGFLFGALPFLSRPFPANCGPNVAHIGLGRGSVGAAMALASDSSKQPARGSTADIGGSHLRSLSRVCGRAVRWTVPDGVEETKVVQPRSAWMSGASATMHP